MTFGEDKRISSKFSPKKVNPIRAYEDGGKWWQRCACSPPNLASLCSCWICSKWILFKNWAPPKSPNMIKYDCVSPISLLKLPFWGVYPRFWHTYLYDSICLLPWQVTCHPSLALEEPGQWGSSQVFLLMSSALMFGSYPLVNDYKKLWKDPPCHAINGKTHYFYGHVQ